MKRYIYSAQKNSSGGEIIDTLTFGNLKIVYETYWHSFLQERIIVYSGNKVIASVSHIDNPDAVDAFWTDAAEYLDSIDTSGGEAGYYKYLNAYDSVKREIVSLLREYADELSTGTYDPVSGQRLD